MRFLLSTFLLILVWPLGFWRPFTGLNAQTTPSSTERPLPLLFFGLHIENAGSTTVWPRVPFGSWRLWDTGASWPEVEPLEGHWNFRSLDRDVALASEHEVPVLLTLGLTPRWASSKPAERGYLGPGSAAMPKSLADWRTYVREVATRYKGRIHEYEIWNEPNFPRFFSGDVDQMLLLTREASGILKDIDPSNVVVSPSAVTAQGIPWFEEFLKKGGARYVDVIAYHFYVSPLSPEAMVPTIKRVRELMTQYGVAGKPLWNTETGWLIQNKRGTVGPWGPFRRVLSPGLAASYVGRTYILNWAFGVERFYWYSWDNPGFGLTEANGNELKPAARAYKRIEDWLLGTTMKACSVDQQNTWTCEFQPEAKPSFWIVWNAERKFDLSPPADWHVTHWTKLNGLSGNLSQDGKIAIGPVPTLLTE